MPDTSLVSGGNKKTAWERVFWWSQASSGPEFPWLETEHEVPRNGLLAKYTSLDKTRADFLLGTSKNCFCYSYALEFGQGILSTRDIY